MYAKSFGLGTTLEELRHYFGNHVAMAKLWHEDIIAGEPPPSRGYNFEDKKKCFVEGLRRTVSKELPVAGDITYAKLSELADSADALDWSRREAIEELYRMFEDLTGQRTEPFRIRSGGTGTG